MKPIILKVYPKRPGSEGMSDTHRKQYQFLFICFIFIWIFMINPTLAYSNETEPEPPSATPGACRERLNHKGKRISWNTRRWRGIPFYLSPEKEYRLHSMRDALGGRALFLSRLGENIQWIQHFESTALLANDVALFEHLLDIQSSELGLAVAAYQILTPTQLTMTLPETFPLAELVEDTIDVSQLMLYEIEYNKMVKKVSTALSEKGGFKVELKKDPNLIFFNDFLDVSYSKDGVTHHGRIGAHGVMVKPHDRGKFLLFGFY